MNTIETVRNNCSSLETYCNVLLNLNGSIVVDPNTLNMDPDPEFCPNLDPDPGLSSQF